MSYMKPESLILKYLPYFEFEGGDAYLAEHPDFVDELLDDNSDDEGMPSKTTFVYNFQSAVQVAVFGRDPNKHPVKLFNGLDDLHAVVKLLDANFTRLKIRFAQNPFLHLNEIEDISILERVVALAKAQAVQTAPLWDDVDVGYQFNPSSKKLSSLLANESLDQCLTGFEEDDGWDQPIRYDETGQFRIPPLPLRFRNRQASQSQLSQTNLSLSAFLPE